MSDTMDIQFNSSQEIIGFSSQTLEFNDDYQPSTQEIAGIHTQEASNASDFFDNLRESQITENESKIKIELTDVSIDSSTDCHTITEKKKRGRKRKIRTPEEMVVHLKEKKEKNRLAAQRLRQKKGTEIAKHDQEVTQLEANVRAKRHFAELIEKSVNQLRNKIKVMLEPKLKVNSLDNKTEENEANPSTADSHSSSSSQTSNKKTDQKTNKKQFSKLEPKEASNHLCVSR